jgi:hypothetical protein
MTDFNVLIPLLVLLPLFCYKIHALCSLIFYQGFQNFKSIGNSSSSISSISKEIAETTKKHEAYVSSKPTIFFPIFPKTDESESVIKYVLELLNQRWNQEITKVSLIDGMLVPVVKPGHTAKIIHEDIEIYIIGGDSTEKTIINIESFCMKKIREFLDNIILENNLDKISCSAKDDELYEFTNIKKKLTGYNQFALFKSNTNATYYDFSNLPGTHIRQIEDRFKFMAS